MKEILALQNNFKDHIYQKSDLEILNNLPYSKEEALARLNIYRNNVLGNYDSVLESIFEVVLQLVGEKYFSQLCDSYNQEFHSKSGNLDNFGDEFPRFLKKIKSQHKLEFLPDLAKLELLFHKAYFANSSAIFDLQKFKTIKEDDFFNLKFDLHPSCSIFASKFAVFSIWKNNVENKKEKIDAFNPEFALVERARGMVNIHNINQEEFLFLKNISSSKPKKNLFQTYEKISQTTNKECDIGQMVNKFIASGVITNFKIGE